MQNIALKILFLLLSVQAYAQATVSQRIFCQYDETDARGCDKYGANEPIKRIQAHLILEDYYTACSECRKALKSELTSNELHKYYLDALFKTGQEKKALRHLKEIPKDIAYDSEILETAAWGVISCASKSDAPLIRVTSYLAAFLGNDAKGVSILEKGLQDPNLQIRRVCFQLVSEMRDPILQEKVYNAFKNEAQHDLKVEAVKAVGKMKIKKALPNLLRLIARNNTELDLKASAIESIVFLCDDVSRQEIAKLRDSSYAGLKELACQIVAFYEKKDDIDLILPLLKHWKPGVRKAALIAIGRTKVNQVGTKKVKEIIRTMVNDLDSEVAITACWALGLYDSQEGQRLIKVWLHQKDRNKRVYAAGALVSMGQKGFPLIHEEMLKSDDPYVKMNLALACICYRGKKSGNQVNSACKILSETLIDSKKRWMWKEEGVIKVIAPSNLSYAMSVGPNPEMMSQLVRLEILNALAIAEYPGTQEAIKKFLLEKSWGISGTAAVLLLSEGDENALDIVRELLYQGGKEVKIQAALALALWGGDEEALDTLQKSYDTAERETKIKILEGIAQIGSRESIPFLADRLKEQHPTLRVISAAAMIMTLYH